VTSLYSGTAKVFAAALRVYLRSISATLRIRITLSDGPAIADIEDGATRLLQLSTVSAPLVFPLWTTDQINLLATAFGSRPLRSLAAKHFSFFVDDSLGGIIMDSSLRRLGLGTIRISDTDAAARLRTLRCFMESKPTAFLVVDGRGPYFQVGSGIVNLARATRATVVPCAAAASAAVTLYSRGAQVAVPLPRSEIRVAFGKPRFFDNRAPVGNVADEAAAIATALATVAAQARQ